MFYIPFSKGEFKLNELSFKEVYFSIVDPQDNECPIEYSGYTIIPDENANHFLRKNLLEILNKLNTNIQSGGCGGYDFYYSFPDWFGQVLTLAAALGEETFSKTTTFLQNLYSIYTTFNGDSEYLWGSLIKNPNYLDYKEIANRTEAYCHSTENQ